MFLSFPLLCAYRFAIGVPPSTPGGATTLTGLQVFFGSLEVELPATCPAIGAMVYVPTAVRLFFYNVTVFHVSKRVPLLKLYPRCNPVGLVLTFLIKLLRYTEDILPLFGQLFGTLSTPVCGDPQGRGLVPVRMPPNLSPHRS